MTQGFAPAKADPTNLLQQTVMCQSFRDQEILI